MIPQRILVPTDLSENAARAYPYARALAERFGSRLDVVHIIPSTDELSLLLARSGAPFEQTKELYTMLQAERQAQLEAIAQEAFGDLLGEIRISLGRPFEALLESINSGRYELVVLSTRGAGNVPVGAGATAERILRRAQVPVFAVPADAPETPRWERILYPTDFSEVSRAALPWALLLAEAFGSTLVVFHMLYLGEDPQVIEKAPSEAELEAMRQRLHAHLGTVHPLESEDSIRRTAESAPVRLERVLVRGYAAYDEILQYAEEQADAIVMATHGRTGLAHLLLGSTAEKVLHHSRKPVLVIRPERFRS
ncbi:MAG: universal stress protein [Bacteroidetes bacterium]|nr:universal stress protein [Rhodothermia bacterium]MCS7154617.1 universal stress protein [Bacteroidota bacterium]MCX7906334.1 universal stress protein [Bacteroidota bacterium]MDW8137410.1 universal stress protein [Bacteroidota bacterium]MDW8285636.1 universal stress protein [Bacteroidota bacterium]